MDTRTSDSHLVRTLAPVTAVVSLVDLDLDLNCLGGHVCKSASHAHGVLQELGLSAFHRFNPEKMEREKRSMKKRKSGEKGLSIQRFQRFNTFSFSSNTAVLFRPDSEGTLLHLVSKQLALMYLLCQFASTKEPNGSGVFLN